MVVQKSCVRSFLIFLVLSSLCSTQSPSSAAVYTTTATFTTDDTVTGVLFAGATATSARIFHPSDSFTEFRYVAPTTTVVVDAGPFVTSVEHIASASTDIIITSPSAAETIIIAAGSAVDVYVEASTTQVGVAIASFAVNADFGSTRGYDIDVTGLYTYCWYPISVCIPIRRIKRLNFGM